MTNVENRIIVIGSGGHYGVETTSWDASAMPNIADFTNAILNISSLNSFLERINDEKKPEAQRVKLADIINNNIKYVEDRLINILHSKGNIFVICAPESNARVHAKFLDNYKWSPFQIELLKEEGTSIHLFDNSFKNYFKYIKKWLFCFAETGNVSSQVISFYENKYYIKPNISIIAENRYKKPISIKFNYSVHERIKVTATTKAFIETLGQEFHDYKNEAEHISGDIVFLPPPTELENKESINLLLEDLFGIQQKTLPPIDIKKILMPREHTLNQEIENKNAQISTLSHEINTIQKSKDELVKFKQLFYETGKPLEEICKLAFSELGCKIDGSAEDFIIIKDDKEAIIEVKGKEGVIERKDGAQLSQNRRNYAISQEKEMKEVKAILLGNPWRLLFPIEERGNKDLFAPHLIKDAKNEEMALVTTQELFSAYCAFLEGKITNEEIISRLFSGVGITRLIEGA